MASTSFKRPRPRIPALSDPLNFGSRAAAPVRTHRRNSPWKAILMPLQRRACTLSRRAPIEETAAAGTCGLPDGISVHQTQIHVHSPAFLALFLLSLSSRATPSDRLQGLDQPRGLNYRESFEMVNPVHFMGQSQNSIGLPAHRLSQNFNQGNLETGGLSSALRSRCTSHLPLKPFDDPHRLVSSQGPDRAFSRKGTDLGM